MCLKQKTVPNKRSKAILLLADVLFCVQQHMDNASSKKVFCATSSFSLLLKARSYFLRSHKKIFAFFLCALQKWFLQLARKDICDFQFCEDSKSKQTLKEGTKMWTTYLPFPQKLLWKKQQNNDAFCKKDFVPPHINLLGYLHDVMFAESRYCLLRTHTTICARSTNNFRRTQPKIFARSKKVLCTLQILFCESCKNGSVQKSLRRARIPVALRLNSIDYYI